MNSPQWFLNHSWSQVHSKTKMKHGPFCKSRRVSVLEIFSTAHSCIIHYMLSMGRKIWQFLWVMPLFATVLCDREHPSAAVSKSKSTVSARLRKRWLLCLCSGKSRVPPVVQLMLNNSPWRDLKVLNDPRPVWFNETLVDRFKRDQSRQRFIWCSTWASFKVTALTSANVWVNP